MKKADKLYIESFTQYKRRKSIEVHMGSLPLGNGNPIRTQTMTNTNTNEIDQTTEQCKKAFDKGADYIRITAQGIKEAEALKEIRQHLNESGYKKPLIADIHFNPKAAEKALESVEKIRINPGNYTDKSLFLNQRGNNEKSYETGLKDMEKRFIPLIIKCKELGKTIRIGANHGSLSARIVGKYGDTPEGMAESVMEFLRICKSKGYKDVVVSMKSSNTRVMVQATRLLVYKMRTEGIEQPIHLGVTEAGEGEDGRIKSAVGIGALLNDGIGDTLRVSLTEDPEYEIPVAKRIINNYKNRESHSFILPVGEVPINPYVYKRRNTYSVKNIGGNNVPIVIGNFSPSEINPCDYFYSNNSLISSIDGDKITYPILDVNEYINKETKGIKFLSCSHQDFNNEILEKLKKDKSTILILETNNLNGYAEQRALIFELILKNCEIPVILKRSYQENELDNLQIKASCDLGPLFLDGLADGIWISNEGKVEKEEIGKLSFSILQAARVRINKTEFISCPGCGRTLFNLQVSTRKVKERLSHLKGLKIAVMGCIVNGPGEMADADYGYVGAGSGKINLYKGKNVVEKNISEKEAIERLICLIKSNGDWKD